MRALALPIVRTLLLLGLPMLLGATAAAEDRILLGTASANAGTAGVTVDVAITHDDPIHAISLALVYDRDILTLRQISDEGTTTAELGAEFFHPTIDNLEGQAVLGIIFSFDGEPYSAVALEASPETPQRIAVLTFDIAPGVPPGDYLVALVDKVGTPPVSNVFSREGTTIRPSLTSGAVTVNNENTFRLESVNARPGTRIEVKALARHPEPIQAYSVAFLFDRSILTYVGSTCLGTDADLALKPASIELFQPKLDLEYSPTQGRIAVGAVVDYVPPFADGQLVPASPNGYQTIARFTFDVVDDPALIGGSSELILHNSGIISAGNNIIVVDGESFNPALLDGSVVFTAAPIFRRSMVNADSRIDISDGIFLLGYLFLGAEPPSCIDAADINDDDRFDLSDAISLFNYLFTGGRRPDDPFESCGPDPTPSDLGCNVSAQCP